MNKITAGFLLLSFLLLNSCGPAATFDTPQPAGARAMRSIPERLHGDYIAEDEASKLVIDDHYIIRRYDFYSSVHRDSLGTSYQQKADTLIDVSDGRRRKISMEGDTVILHVVRADPYLHCRKSIF